MKKVLAFALILFGLNLAGSAYSQDVVLEDVGLYDNYQVVYSPYLKQFSYDGMAPDRIVLTKKTSDGTGSYSSYYYPNGNLAISLNSNYEFLHQGRLIACDNAGLKYYEVKFKNDKFVSKKLSYWAVKRLFKGAKVVKISKFKDNKLFVDGSDDLLLLYNNTDEYFHKYSLEPSSAKVSEIAGLIDLKKSDVIIFSHYGEDSPLNSKYEIIKR